MQLAKYFVQEDNGAVKCVLCPHNCFLKPGQKGICHVRSNDNGILISENYGKLSAIHLDPVEKKPLYHYFPGKQVLSIGSVGCNLRCNFCQNSDISQIGVADFQWFKNNTVEEIVNEALQTPSNIGIAYTYNEPVVFYEYMFDVATVAKTKGLKNIMVSNGFIHPEPLLDIIPIIDAFNIDLKSFTEEFYKKETHSQLTPVKNTLINIRKSGKHLEITNLIIPQLNDNTEDFKAMVKWIAEELGELTVLHLSKYFPKYHAKQPPTPENKLRNLMDIAQKYLKYVYLGNINNGSDTRCHSCDTLLVKRNNYNTSVIGLSAQGNCIHCGIKIMDR